MVENNNPAQAVEAQVSTTAATAPASYQYAGFWRRFAAVLLDGIIIVIPIFILNFILGFVLGKSATIVSFIVQFGIGFLYFVFYQSKAGQTVGKRVLGVKVVTATGQTPSLFTFFLREIIGKWVSSLILLLGYLWAIFDSKKQALHDKIAGTYVIRL